VRLLRLTKGMYNVLSAALKLLSVQAKVPAARPLLAGEAPLMGEPVNNQAPAALVLEEDILQQEGSTALEKDSDTGVAAGALMLILRTAVVLESPDPVQVTMAL